jgi:hypothetical protein
VVGSTRAIQPGPLTQPPFITDPLRGLGRMYPVLRDSRGNPGPPTHSVEGPGSLTRQSQPPPPVATHFMPRRTMIALSRTIPRRSGSIRNMFVPTATAGARTISSEITAAPSPTTPRRSGSIPSLPLPTPGAAMRTMRWGKSTAPTPTSIRQSGSKGRPLLASRSRQGCAIVDDATLLVSRGGSESRCR